MTVVEVMARCKADELCAKALSGETCLSCRGIDKRTGRPYGDHGTALQAIEFAIYSPDCRFEEAAFLKNWMEGNLDDFPEFYEWLEKKEST